jgi:xanthine dehydrogenase YagR molybdenum-binding subunit
MTHSQNSGTTGFKKAMGPDGGATTETLESSHIWHDGQIIVIVLADTFEAAREAANKVQVRSFEAYAGVSLPNRSLDVRYWSRHG